MKRALAILLTGALLAGLFILGSYWAFFSPSPPPDIRVVVSTEEQAQAASGLTGMPLTREARVSPWVALYVREKSQQGRGATGHRSRDWIRPRAAPAGRI